MSELPPIDLVLVWHHHQPDYRSPERNHAVLPWVRLHATKDYLDMAVRLAGHPNVRATFNFVPVLVDQLEEAIRGGSDALFDLLARPVESLAPDERAALVRRLAAAPGHALERWVAYRRLVEAASRRDAATATSGPTDGELLALEVWFLLAWLDPLFQGEPEAARALSHTSTFGPEHRDDLLRLHARLLPEVVPAHRALAERGQIELSTSPYYHPILPLVFDLQSARRARPEIAMPGEGFAAPADARLQIERAIARHAEAFGAKPVGMWPSEGSVSPEIAELAAACGLHWLASDEGVLWASLPEAQRRRGALYRPWVLATNAGPIALLFRDRELSDRIGFVYQRWDATEAARDFVQRLRRIARDHAGVTPPLVTVILDGENCWEGYADDGGPFLEALYQALESAPDIRTRTPGQAVAAHPEPGTLVRLHSGSWIDADFHVWVGHPEKNRAWELLARARRALAQRGGGPESHPEAWESLFRAEGSDWFWWFGDDHATTDRDLFDRLFREHLRATYTRVGAEAPATLQVPICRPRHAVATHVRPHGFVHPVVDGRRTQFYEWYAAGRVILAPGGGAMHRAAGLVRDLYYGFDDARLYVRLDFAAAEPPGAGLRMRLEIAEPHASRVEVVGLERGERDVRWGSGEGREALVDGAVCRIDSILELSVPFATLGLAPGDAVEMLVQAVRDGQPVESLPADDLIRLVVPDATFEAMMWSA